MTRRITKKNNRKRKNERPFSLTISPSKHSSTVSPYSSTNDESAFHSIKEKANYSKLMGPDAKSALSDIRKEIKQNKLSDLIKSKFNTVLTILGDIENTSITKDDLQNHLKHVGTFEKKIQTTFKKIKKINELTMKEVKTGNDLTKNEIGELHKLIKQKQHPIILKTIDKDVPFLKAKSLSPLMSLSALNETVKCGKGLKKCGRGTRCKKGNCVGK